ncbi:predicted protein [Chaetoceros tenuissimus]|uniref:Uncharacterized protein n=1 Tax=Chaetoceros tenuissimus TaxID=426638 RepID=A0AAD3CE50_9STRA|nr:predicted protein [Chaetoceros tenuissimus]
MSTINPDVLELYWNNEFEKIESILDSAEYTKAEKVSMILEQYEYEDDEGITQKQNLFSELCAYYTKERRFWSKLPIELPIKVLRILGENLGNYVDEINTIGKGNRNAEDVKQLLQVILEESDVLTSLLILFHRMSVAGKWADNRREAEKIYEDFLISSKEENIYAKKSIRYIRYVPTEQTKEILLCDEDYDAADTDYVFYKHATLLEIALHKHAQIQVIRDLVRIGGKDLLLMSDRSLIQGAIIEHDDAVEIVKL